MGKKNKGCRQSNGKKGLALHWTSKQEDKYLKKQESKDEKKETSPSKKEADRSHDFGGKYKKKKNNK